MKAMKRGRKSKFNDKLKETILRLYSEGRTDEQVADIIGVCVKTLHNWRGKHPEFLQALKEAKQIADDLVEASLFSRAVGYSHKEEKVFQYEGHIITHETLKHYPPDTTAAIFWLKNRQPEKWREKQPGEEDKTVTLKGSIAVEKTDLEERISQLKGEK